MFSLNFILSKKKSKNVGKPPIAQELWPVNRVYVHSPWSKSYRVMGNDNRWAPVTLDFCAAEKSAIDFWNA